MSQGRPLPLNEWRERYGATRADRAEKINKTLPPESPVGNLPPPRALWAWSPFPREDGTENTVATKGILGTGNIDFMGHVEVRSDDSVQLRRRFVRSQRCTEPGQNLYSDGVYRVRLQNVNGERAVSCTCPDWDNRGPCKHMLAVDARIGEELEEENIQAAYGFDPEEQGYADYLDDLQEEQPEPGFYVTRSGRISRPRKRYGRDEFVTAAIGAPEGWVFV